MAVNVGAPVIGHRLGHYLIVEKIGSGGMGEVYRATDERLERDVAIKVLPPGTLSDESARKNFRKEALTLSKLNHPHIATVHDFNTQEGVDFLVMEFVPGTSLAQRLTAGPLPEKEVVRLGTQIAEALAEAHGIGIIHRDLKPGNIAVNNKGLAKVLDFGLAQWVDPGPASTSAVTSDSLARTQRAVGTLPYMAPEQLREDPVDARTDLYALGTVLYEMATGQRAFPESNAPRLIDSILNRPPAAPRGLNPRVSPDLERIVLKCLEKDPENRYQAAKEVVVDLRRLAMSATAPTAAVPPLPRKRKLRAMTAAAAAAVVLLAVLFALNVGDWRERLLRGDTSGRIESLAVLPLANISGDPGQEYFADGMTEALIAELSKIKALKVISRTSVMQFKNAKKPLPQIARELGVDAVVEGSVLREGDQVRITVQLIRGRSDEHLWADSYQRELGSILALQGEVARAIAAQVRIALTPQEQKGFSGPRRVDPQAYEAYLRGRYHWNRRTGQDIRKATEYFQQAIAEDPNYALAYAGLADAYNVLTVYSDVAPEDKYLPAKAAALKALELDESLAEAHAALAVIKLDNEWDFAGAEREYRRAIELNSNYATAHQWLADYLVVVGRVDEAIAEIELARELDPLSLIINTATGGTLLRARRYDEAIAQLKKTLEMDPNFSLAHHKLKEAYLEKKMFAEAIQEGERAAIAAGEDPEKAVRVAAALREAYTRAGERGYWRKRLELISGSPRQGDTVRYDESPYHVASLYARLGDSNRALDWLQRAVAERDSFILYLKTAPEFDALRSDPRAHDLLRRVGFPQ